MPMLILIRHMIIALIVIYSCTENLRLARALALRMISNKAGRLLSAAADLPSFDFDITFHISTQLARSSPILMFVTFWATIEN